MPLMIGRKEGERILIGDNIVIEVAKIRRGQVQLSINAPQDVPIRRLDLKQQDTKRGAN